MLNKHMIINDNYSNANQILADPSLQFSVGCIVPTSVGSTSTIARAGTPIKIDLTNINKGCEKVDNTTVFANAVLLHDVDLSHGQSNGTALIFGFVDLNKIDTPTQTAIKTALSKDGATKLITLVNYNG